MTKLNLLLIEFSNQHRLEKPTADEKGFYSLIIDDMEVKCFEKFGKGYFCAKLTTMPQQASNLPVVLKDLMNHALARAKSQKCSLGLGEDGNLILFERFDTDAMNLYDFSDTLEKFMNALEEYRRFIASEHSEGPSEHTMIITP